MNEHEEYLTILNTVFRKFGTKGANLLVTKILSDMDGRMINQAADGIWLIMRKKIKDTPPEILSQITPLKGVTRIIAYILLVAPSYFADLSIEQIESGYEELIPHWEAMSKIYHQGNPREVES